MKHLLRPIVLLVLTLLLLASCSPRERAEFEARQDELSVIHHVLWRTQCVGLHSVCIRSFDAGYQPGDTVAIYLPMGTLDTTGYSTPLEYALLNPVDTFYVQ